jgi:predicted ATP-dependent serine protease
MSSSKKTMKNLIQTLKQAGQDQEFYPTTNEIIFALATKLGTHSKISILEVGAGNGKVFRKLEEFNPNLQLEKFAIEQSEILIAQREDSLSGSAIAATLEGARPLLLEVQALVTQSVYGTPQRTVTGFDLRRLQLLLAVLEKRGGFQFGMKDVFVNIAGGIKIEDPSTDLAIICALLSSYEDVPLPHHICFAGEVGLNGEIRAVNRIEQRIAEAEKLGFEKIIVSSYNKKSFNPKAHSIQVLALSRVDEVYQQLF